jgi:cytochrome P450
VRRCLAASYASVLMKQVIRTVLSEMEIRPVDARSERPIRNAIAFVPHRHALVIATPHERSASAAPAGSDQQRSAA